MKNIIRSLGLIISFSTAAVATVWIGDANAFEIRMNAVACTDAMPYYGSGNATADVFNGDYDGYASLACAYPETSDLPKYAVNSARVYGFNNSAGDWVVSRACKRYYNGTSGSCGNSSYAGNSGYFVSYPNLSAWSTSTGTAYVYVQVPGDATVTGLYFRD